jgi:hypothetical protein
LKALLRITLLLLLPLSMFAGNDNKRGQAGTTQLLINPWARSSGWAGANTGSIRGVEAMNFNVGGLRGVGNTDFIFSNTNLFRGAGINIYSVGFGQRVSSTGVLGISMMYFDLGDFIRTTEDNPDNDLIFKPQFFNFSVAYTKTFSRTISGGILVKGVSESIDNVGGFGIAVDAGIQYQTNIFDATSDKQPFKFGVALRNVGPKMRYSGPGFSFRGRAPGNDFPMTQSMPVAAFEIPALLNIGLSYDFEPEELHRITTAANFTSNTFTKDHYQFGAEYGFKEMFMFRAGLDYSAKVFTGDRTVAETGPTFGASVIYPIKFTKSGEMVQDYAATENAKKAQSKLGIDFSYAFTERFGGTFRIGLNLSL